ncbi:MAG: hypothetical protein HY016_11095, partial [Nitrosomonadales bacterium]|nr:hypothetical protein [Nitrosomonadales bacterium]
FADKNVGVGKAVTVTGYTITGVDAANYVLVQPAGLTATITAASLAVTGVTAANKIYDGGITTTLGGIAVIAPLTGDTVALGGVGVGTFADKNAATGKVVNVSGYTITGVDAGNYTLVQPAGLTATINPYVVSLTGTRVYDGSTSIAPVAAPPTSPSATTFTFNPLVGAETLTVTGTGSVLSANASATAQALTLGTLALGNGTGLASNYTLTGGTHTAKINPRPANLTGTRAYDGTMNVASTIFTFGNLVGTETLTLSGTGTISSPNASATPYPVTLGTLALGNGTGLASNYTFAGGSQTALITAASVALVVTASNASKTYGSTLTLGAIAAPTTAWTATGLIGTDTIGSVTLASTGAVSTANVGSYPIATSNAVFSSGSASNYTINYSSLGTLTVNPYAVSLTGTRAYDGTTNAVASIFTLGTLANNETLTLSGVGTVASKDAGAGKAVTLGTLALGNGTGLASNYTFIGGSQTLTINPALLTAAITGTPAKVYDGTTAATLASTNYALTGFVGTEGATVNQTVGAYNTKDVTTATTVSATLAAANYTATGTTLLSNYTLPTTASGAGKINVRPVNLTGVRAYDGTVNVASTIFTLGNLVGAETLTLTGAGSVASANASATPYAVTLGTLALGNGTTGTASNYTFIGGTQVATINPALLTAAIIGTPPRAYNGLTAATLASTNYSLTGFIGTDGATVNQTVGAYNSKDVAAATTVTATLAAANYTATGTTLLSNYTLPTTASGAGKINPYVITSLSGTRAYDGSTSIAPVAAAPTTPTATSFTFSPLVGTETLTLTGTGSVLSANASATAQALTLGTLALANGLNGGLAANYTLTGGAAPTVTITPALLNAAIIGTPTRVYNGLTAATLASTNYALTGFIGTEGATVNQTVGAYNSKDVVTATTVSATLAAANFTANTGTLLSNYILPTTASGAGAITPAPLTAAISGIPTKVYNGTTAATLASTNYAITGFVTGEGAAVNQTAGTYYTSTALTTTAKDVTTATTVSATLTAANYTANLGTLLSNYTLPTSASGAGTITPALLTAAIIGAPTRVYNGLTAATLASTNYAITGFVTGEGAAVNQTVGAYNSKDVVTATTVNATLAATNYTANTGTLLSNYILPTTASGAGTITPAPLTAAITGTPTRVYNGLTAATLASTNYAITGFVTGEGATVNQTVGAYNSKDVVTATTVSANLAAANYTANLGTLLSNYILPLTASGAGKINPYVIATMTGTRQYDGTTSMAQVAAPPAIPSATAFTFSPLVNTETLTLAGAGSVASANVGTYTLTLGTLALGNGLNGGLASNYTLTGGTQTGVITPAIINLNGVRTYDATTALAAGAFHGFGLAAGNLATGINGETLILTGSGSVTSKNVGTSSVASGTMSLGTLALSSGTGSATNYTLVGGVHTANILAAPLLISGVTAMNKVYDGTTAASLTGTAALSNPFAGDVVSLGGVGVGTFNSKNAANGVVVNVAGYTISGTDAGNYALVQPQGITANIAQRPITWTGTPAAANRTYDGTTTTAITGVTFDTPTATSGLVAGDFAYMAGVLTTPDAGIAKYVSVAFAGKDANNYSIALPTGFLTANISPASLTLSAVVNNTSKIYGSTLNLGSTTSFTATGLVGSDKIAGVNLVSTGAVASANVGNYAILATDPVFSWGNASNYIISSASTTGTLTVNPYTIASMTANRVYDATTAMNGSAFGAVAGINGETLTLSGSGSVLSKNVGTGKVVTLGTLVLANGSGLASNYILGTTGAYTANITPANLAVTGVAAANKVYDATTAVTLSGAGSITPFGTDVVTLSGTASGAFADKNAGNGKAVLVTGFSISGTDAANYSLVQPLVSANIAQKAISWSGTPLATNREYDATLTTNISGASLSGVLAGDTAGLGGLMADPNVGLAKPVSLVVTGPDGRNYSITQPVPGMTVNIAPRNLAVTADNKYMMFGSTIPSLTYSLGGSGLAGSDMLSSVFTGSLYVNVTGVLSGSTTPITQGSLVLTIGAGGNYVIGTFNNGTMTVQ